VSWPSVPIGDFCDLKNGFAFKSDDYIEHSNTLNCRMSNIRPGGYFDIEYNAKYLSDDYAEKYSEYLLQDGDLVIAMTDLASEPKILGVPTIVKTNGKNILLNQRVGKLIIKNESAIHKPFLQQVLNYPKVRQVYKKFAGGGLQINVGKADILSVKIPLPPLPEQRRIADILNQTDALRGKRREALAQLDSLTQSIFIEMFGDAQTIFNKWPSKKLGEILDFLTSGSRGWAEYYSDSGALFLRVQNVCKDELKLNDVAFVNAPNSAEAKRTKVQEGDVLLSITADLGRTAVIPAGLGDAHINQHLSILRTSHVIPSYLSAFLTSTAGQREIHGRDKHGVKAGLNFDDIRSFRLPIPPQLLQYEFCQRVEAVVKQRLLHQQALNELDALFASLQHRAFRGEL
jgi:type I restriction enzyme S subunit